MTHSRNLPLADTTVQINPMGLGCMNLSHAYGVPPSFEAASALLHAALDAGVDFFDTAALYGFGANETLVGKILSAHPALRRQFILASKCGMTGVDVNGDGKPVRVIDGRPETIKATIDASLSRLQCDVIDLYYLHRWDKKVPIEDSVGALSDLVRAGKIRGIGLSEVSASTLMKAQAVHTISAVQTEYSLWTRNPEIAVLKACQDHGIAFVAFSPVARGFFSNTPLDTSAFDAKDIRRTMPRFLADNYANNLNLHRQYAALCVQIGHSPIEVALAWVLQQAPHIVAIPGTTQIKHLHENMGAANVRLDVGRIAKLDAMFSPDIAAGARYNEQGVSEVDTERF